MRIIYPILLIILTAAISSAQPIGTVVIDPGHGGFDSGIKTPQLDEKDFALTLSKELRAVLSEGNKKVVLTREVSRYLSFEERTSASERAKADIFISIHGSLQEGEGGGYAVYITRYPEGELPPKKKYSPQSKQKEYIAESRALAHAVAEAIKTELGAKVFLREIPLPMLNPVAAPAVLIEAPMANAKEARHLAAAIAKGISNYESR